jgi:hypothetical protein
MACPTRGALFQGCANIWPTTSERGVRACDFYCTWHDQGALHALFLRSWRSWLSWPLLCHAVRVLHNVLREALTALDMVGGMIISTVGSMVGIVTGPGPARQVSCLLTRSVLLHGGSMMPSHVSACVPYACVHK